MPGPFKGSIKLDIRDSKPDWSAFLDPTAPKNAPNVMVILYDDTGQAAWSTYGGRIDMPTLDRLARNGLTYTQWHTTSVCSPTRSCFLTGRNHHHNGFGSISEMAVGFLATADTSLLKTDHRQGASRRGLEVPTGLARTTTCRWTPSTSVPPRRRGRSGWDTTASTASSAARPISGIPS